MNNQFTALLIFVASILISSVSFAGSGHHGKGRFMALFDTNADDVVTMDEFRAAAADRFSKMDGDSSGTVTKEEFRNYLMAKRQQRNEQRFLQADVNTDGNISQQEYLDYKLNKAKARFERMDKDGSGTLSKDEFKKKRRHGKKYGKHGKGGIFSKLDKNANGEITRDESLVAWSDWFARIDSNGDQVVTADEVREYRIKKLNSKP